MRRHRYEDYYAQTELKLRQAEAGQGDVPIFTNVACEGLSKFQGHLVDYACTHTENYQHKLKLADVLQDSWSGGNAKLLQEYLDKCKETPGKVEDDPDYVRFKED